MIAIAFIACKKEPPLNKTSNPPPPIEYGTVVFELYFQFPQNARIAHRLGVHHNIIDAQNAYENNMVDNWVTTVGTWSKRVYSYTEYAEVSRYYNYTVTCGDTINCGGFGNRIQNNVGEFYVPLNDTVFVRDTIIP